MRPTIIDRPRLTPSCALLVALAALVAGCDDGGGGTDPGPDLGVDESPVPRRTSHDFTFADGRTMHYVEQGEGEPILFLHGIPTSSFLWRNVTPSVAAHGRTIAVDLMGFGESDAIENGHQIQNQAARLEELVEGLGLDRVRLVLHDWGGPVGLAFAAAHPERVSAIALFETAFAPFPTEELLPLGVRLTRDPDTGRSLIIEQNFWIETALGNNQYNAQPAPALGDRFLLKNLPEETLDVYREPFRDPADRELLWLFPLELAFLDQPGPQLDLWLGFAAYTATVDIPKLVIFGNPGMGLQPDGAFPDPETGEPMVDPATGEIVSVENIVLGRVSPEVGGWVVPGEVRRMRSGSTHFLQEDAPEELSAILEDWVASTP